MKTRMVLLIDNVHMGQGHDGLSALARKFRRDPAKLNPGDLLVFVNRARDKMKILGSGGVVLGYLRMPEGKKLQAHHLHEISLAFGGPKVSGAVHTHKDFEQVLSIGALNKKPYSIFNVKADAELTAKEAH